MTFVKGQPRPAGAGRKKGTPNKATAEFTKAIESLGPFDGDSVAFMTMIYKHADLPLGVRMQAANSVLNFERPRLSQVDVVTRSLDKLPDKQFFQAWDDLAGFLAQHGRPKLLEASVGAAERTTADVAAEVQSEDAEAKPTKED